MNINSNIENLFKIDISFHITYFDDKSLGTSYPQGYRIHPLSFGLTDTLGDCDSLLREWIKKETDPTVISLNEVWPQKWPYHRCISKNLGKIAKMVEKMSQLSSARYVKHT